jgi:hypothetical protein
MYTKAHILSLNLGEQRRTEALAVVDEFERESEPSKSRKQSMAIGGFGITRQIELEAANELT